MQHLTPTELKALIFASDFIKRNGFVPSLREIADGISFSHETARRSMNNLAKKGYVHRLPDKSRTFTILREPNEEMLAA